MPWHCRRALRAADRAAALVGGSAIGRTRCGARRADGCHARRLPAARRPRCGALARIPSGAGWPADISEAVRHTCRRALLDRAGAGRRASGEAATADQDRAVTDRRGSLDGDRPGCASCPGRRRPAAARPRPGSAPRGRGEPATAPAQAHYANAGRHRRRRSGAIGARLYPAGGTRVRLARARSAGLPHRFPGPPQVSGRCLGRRQGHRGNRRLPASGCLAVLGRHESR
jgi:hypothetical protein